MAKINLLGVSDYDVATENFELEDFNDDKYRAIALLKDREGHPMLVSKSRESNPKRYRVLYGSCFCYFLDVDKVLDYCVANRCERVKGGIC